MTRRFGRILGRGVREPLLPDREIDAELGLGIHVDVHGARCHVGEGGPYRIEGGENFRADENALRVTDADRVRERVAGDVRVDQADDRADLAEREEMPIKFGPVAHEERDDVALFEAGFLVGVRVLVDELVGLRVRVALVAVQEKSVLRLRSRELLELVRDRFCESSGCRG